MREWGMEGGRKEASKEKWGRKRRKEKRKMRRRKGKERGEGKAGKRGGKGEEGIWAEHNGMTAPYNPPCTTQTTSWRELEDVCALGRSFGSSSVRRSNDRPGAAAASQVPPVTSQPSLLHHVLWMSLLLGWKFRLSCLERWPRSSLPADLSPSPGHGGSVVHLSPKRTQNPKGGLLSSKYPPRTMCHTLIRAHWIWFSLIAVWSEYSVWSEHSCQDKNLQPVHLYRYIPLSFPKTSSTRSSKLPYSDPCLISSNPHESMDILTLSGFSVPTQSITKSTSQNSAQWEHLPSPRFSGPSWMGLPGAASLAITNKLSKLLSESSQPLPPLSDGRKEP